MSVLVSLVSFYFNRVLEKTVLYAHRKELADNQFPINRQ